VLLPFSDVATERDLADIRVAATRSSPAPAKVFPSPTGLPPQR